MNLNLEFDILAHKNMLYFMLKIQLFQVFSICVKIPYVLMKIYVCIKENKCIQNTDILNAASSFAKVAVSGDRNLYSKSVSI